MDFSAALRREALALDKRESRVRLAQLARLALLGLGKATRSQATAGVLEMVQGHCESVKYKRDRLTRDLACFDPFSN